MSDALIDRLKSLSGGDDCLIRLALVEIESLRQQLETERMRLAACGVVAMANTPESAAKAREMLPQYHSASCDDVAATVDREIALRQQLSNMTAERDKLQSYLDDWMYAVGPDGWIEALRQQLVDSQKREVMLREFVSEWLDRQGTDENYMVQKAREALAATVDLDGLILCEKKPFARKISYGSLVFLEGYAELSEGTPLYRALEPK